MKLLESLWGKAAQAPGECGRTVRYNAVCTLLSSHARWFLGETGWQEVLFSLPQDQWVPSPVWLPVALTKHCAQVPLCPHGVDLEVLDGWEAGQMKDAASNNVCSRSSAQPFSSAGTVIWHRSWDGGIFGRWEHWHLHSCSHCISVLRGLQGTPVHTTNAHENLYAGSLLFCLHPFVFICTLPLSPEVLIPFPPTLHLVLSQR